MRHRRVRRSRTRPRAASASRCCAADVRRHPPPRPGRRGDVVVETASALGMRRLSIIDLVDRPPADLTTKTARSGSCSTARSTTTASCAPSSTRARPPLSTPRATPRSIVHAYEEWGEEAFARLRGMFGLALWDRDAANAAARARPRRHQAAVLRRTWRPSVLRLGDQVAARRPAPSTARLDLERARPLPARSCTRPATGRSSPASASCRPAICLALARRAVRGLAVLGTAGRRDVQRHATQDAADATARPCWPTPCSRTWSATCRSARSSPAASTRASSSG